MEFNREKCVCMYIGNKNKNFVYNNIVSVKLKSVAKEKD